MISNPFFNDREHSRQLKAAAKKDIAVALKHPPPDVFRHFMGATYAHPAQYNVTQGDLPIAFSFHRAALQTYLWYQNREEDYTGIINAHLTSTHAEPHHLISTAEEIANDALVLESSQGWVIYNLYSERIMNMISVLRKIMTGEQSWDIKFTALKAVPILFGPVGGYLQSYDETGGKRIVRELCAVMADYLKLYDPPDTHAALVLDFFETIQNDERNAERYGPYVKAQSARIIALDCLWTEDLIRRAQNLSDTPTKGKKALSGQAAKNTLP